MNRKLRTAIWAFVALLLGFQSLAALAQKGEGELRTDQPTGITVPEIIQKFAAKEKAFKLAREKYTWQQDVKVQTIDGDTVTGEYRNVTNVLFDDKGRRTEQVVFAPQPTLEAIQMTKEDFDDIEHRLPFVLTSDEIPEYDITYVGQQREDELQTYVFDVKPKKIEKDKRYFDGRIWVDNHDFQIVKTYGKNVPDLINGKPVTDEKKRKAGESENLFPRFTTWRELIDGKYWFPTYTKIDDTLNFANGPVHIKQIVKYTNYKRFGADVKITYEGQDIGADKDKKDQPQNPQ
jgi:hypothetical protein